MFKNDFEKLTKKIIEIEAEEAADVLEFLEERVDNMASYVKTVVAHEIGVSNARVMLTGGFLSTEAFQNRVMTLDGNRKAAHDVAIASMRQINRMCDCYNVAKICPVTEDRLTCADFCARVTLELFMSGTGRVLGEGDLPALDEVVKRVSQGETIERR